MKNTINQKSPRPRKKQRGRTQPKSVQLMSQFETRSASVKGRDHFINWNLNSSRKVWRDFLIPAKYKILKAGFKKKI